MAPNINPPIEGQQPYPLYNTTFTLHRLSPLYLSRSPASKNRAYPNHITTARSSPGGNATFQPQPAVRLNNATLGLYASHFRDILAGDVLRGVRVGLGAVDGSDGTDGAGVLSGVGALKDVRWRVLPFDDTEDWERELENQRNSNESTFLSVAAGEDHDQQQQLHQRIQQDAEREGERGLHLEVIYEDAKYAAIMLRDSKEEQQQHDTSMDDQQQTAWAHFPVLLTRMPTALRSTLLSFLSNSFDTHASPLRLPSSFITERLERYVGDITSTVSDTGDEQDVREICRRDVKEVLVSIEIRTEHERVSNSGVEGPPEQWHAEPRHFQQGLKTIDITIAKEDIYPLLQRGRKLLDVQSNSGIDDCAEDAEQQILEGPFMTALVRYIATHLALDMSHPYVRIAKVACAGFVLGAASGGDGRLKVLDPLSTPSGVDNDNKNHGGRKVAIERLVNALIGAATTGGKMGVRET